MLFAAAKAIEAYGDDNGQTLNKEHVSSGKLVYLSVFQLVFLPVHKSKLIFIILQPCSIKHRKCEYLIFIREGTKLF